MIINFSVTNYKSICDTQTLSLTHDQTIKDFEQPIIQEIGNGIPNLLRVIAIYGANAAGKSNLFHALYTMQQLVLLSEKDHTYGDKIKQMKPFLLDKDSNHKPCTFDLTFVADCLIDDVVEKIKYRYMFCATEDKIHYETLEAYPRNNKQVWFERTYDEKTSEYSWKFSSYFKCQKDILIDTTLENVLFFSKAVKENNDQLKPLHLFFQNHINIIFSGAINSTQTDRILKETGGKEKIQKFLENLDLGINDLAIEKQILDHNILNFPEGAPEDVRQKILDSIIGTEVFQTKTVHINLETQKPVLFDLSDESDGTRRLFKHAGLFIDALEKGSVLVIDELDTELHCDIMIYLISQFNNIKIKSDNDDGHTENINISNPHNAQFIFTTHNPIALSDNLLRRDQIFFAKKIANQTQIYPLKLAKKKTQDDKEEKKQEYKEEKNLVVRKGENLIRGYLSGDYGAVPDIDKQENINSK